MKLALVLITVALVAAVQAADDVTVQKQARTMVERSLPFIEKNGVAWLKERGACVTCHQSAFLVWTHGEAGRRGFPVDRRKLEEWTNWSLLGAIAMEDGFGDAGEDTLSQLLLSRDPASTWFQKPPRWGHRTVEPYEVILKHLLKKQQPDGNWNAGGQSENPPEIPTAWALLALADREAFLKDMRPGTEGRRDANLGVQRLMQANDAAIPKARAKALAFLKTLEPGKRDDSNEGFATRLLVACKYGMADESQARLKELLARQNGDGGWSERPGQPSDAFATGQSLFAVSLAKLEVEPAVLRRACDFLQRTQRSDGSWPISTAAFHPLSGKHERDAATDEVYVYWATAWATLGLLQTLPATGNPPSP